MDIDNRHTIRPRGDVEPANRAAVAKERFQRRSFISTIST